jgi:hypothetical protein
MLRLRHALPVLAAAAALGAAALPAAAQRAIAAGQTVNGRLTAADPVLPDDSHYHLFRLTARPGDHLVVTLRSEDFDAFLAWGVLSDGELDVRDSDDDSGGGTDAQLRIVIGAEGEYVVRANSLHGGETGAYALRVEAAAPAPLIRPGQTVSGRLEPGDEIARDGSYTDLYLVRGTPGQRVAIVLRSSDFDAYLIGGPPGDDSAHFDDDGAGGTDARLEVVLDADGRYHVRANSLSAGETGAYTLHVQPLR